jgi:hypothetical protein
MGRLNTKKLMKQCRAIAAKQKAAHEQSQQPLPEPPPPVEIKEVTMDMTPAELEQYLTEFLAVARDAHRQHQRAIAAELWPNEAIQDILHAAELAPSMLEGVDVVGKLNHMRSLRRATKQELEVTDIFFFFFYTHKKALDTLENTLGSMRKVLRRQPNDMYRFKTDILSDKGAFLQADMPGEEDNNENKD